MGVGYENDNEQQQKILDANKELKLLAKVELREDDETRNHALATLREWIAKHPDIVNCRTDAPFLLRFLRTKKFSIPQAQDMIERYLIIREVYPQWFRRLDVLDPTISDILDSGYLVPLLQRDEFGRCVLFSNAGRFDPYKYTAADMARVHSMVVESLMDDPENQIRGYSYVNDESGLLMGHITMWSLTDIRNMTRCIQYSTPMRHKSTHLINIPQYATKVFDFVGSLLNDKLRKRLLFHCNIKELHKSISPKILPKEYGGEVPLAVMISELKKKLLVKREQLLALDDMKINVNKKGKILSDFNDNQTGLEGSFRKLEVD